MCCRPPQARCCAAMLTGMEVGPGCRETFGYLQHHLVCEQVTACHSMINSLRCAALSVQFVHTSSLCTHSVSVRTMQDLPRCLLNNNAANEVSLARLLVSQGQWQIAKAPKPGRPSAQLLGDKFSTVAFKLCLEDLRSLVHARARCPGPAVKFTRYYLFRVYETE